MWAHKNCLLFQTLMYHNSVFHDSIAMKFSKRITHLVVQVTEWKYAILALRYEMLCDGE